MITSRTASGGPSTPVVPAGTESRQQEWEYEVLDSLGNDPKAKLNELGKEGWLLVTANPFIFRRPRVGEEDKTRGPVGFAR